MNKIQFFQVSPSELTEMIRSAVIADLKKMLQEFSAPQKEEPEFLSRRDTAAFLQISLPGLHDWCKRGILKPRKIGNRTFFKYSDIIQVLNESSAV